MDSRDAVSEPAVVLALAEQVARSLNGAAAYHLAMALEMIDSGTDLREAGASSIADALAGLSMDRVAHWRGVLDQSTARLITVLDDDYPANLRMVHDHPPFLFMRGSLESSDVRAIAVVGTRQAGEDGLRAATEIARALAQRGITVVSGMAAGIDTAAHTGAMNAGGRTLAVFGTGIDRVYPAANRSLARAIPNSGATLSQFWPDMTPTRWSFPVRNIVTSGLSLGTVVVEAGPTSGARQQAEHALRHGKRLYLLEDLVKNQPWAEALIGAPGVAAISDVDSVLEAIDHELNPAEDMLV